jgi:hypothetical protein
VEAVAGEPCRAHLADAEDEAHRLFGEERLRFARAQDRKAARLVEIGGDLGEKLVAGKPDRDGDAELSFDLGGEARQHLRGRQAMQPFGA